VGPRAILDGAEKRNISVPPEINNDSSIVLPIDYLKIQRTNNCNKTKPHFDFLLYKETEIKCRYGDI
jgi:hypothetical protein